MARSIRNIDRIFGARVTIWSRLWEGSKKVCDLEGFGVWNHQKAKLSKTPSDWPGELF